MPRRPRIHFKGALYHVLLKGRGGSPVFLDDTDGKTFETLVGDSLGKFDHRVHAYCWMPNHIHLVVEIANDPLSRVMQGLGTRYTRYVNAKYNRTGSLFQDRYRTVLVDAERYLLPLVRYVHRNPVVGGLCSGAHRYRWSSHRAYLGLAGNRWLEKARVLSMLGPDEDAALAAYRDFMSWPGEGPSGEAMDRGFEDGILGDADFRASVMARIGPDDRQGSTADSGVVRGPGMEALIRRVARARGYTPAELRAPGRDRSRAEARHMAGYLALSHGIAPLSAVADHFGRDVSTLSRGVDGLRRRLAKDAALRARLEGAEAALLAG